MSLYSVSHSCSYYLQILLITKIITLANCIMSSYICKLTRSLTVAIFKTFVTHRKLFFYSDAFAKVLLRLQGSSWEGLHQVQVSNNFKIIPHDKNF